MKKQFSSFLLLVLLVFMGGKLFAQSKFLFNPGFYFDNPFESEISGGSFIAGLEYRPKANFGIETRAKFGLYSFDRLLYPDHDGFSVIYPSNGDMLYRLYTPQIGIAPRFYYDLDVFYDGLLLYAESEISFGLISGDLAVTGKNEFYKAFSESISYYTINLGLELWEDRSHLKKKDVIMAASVGFSPWGLKKHFEKHIPDSYDGGFPRQGATLRLFLTFKVPVGKNVGVR
jgi:hypothetical protein